MNFSKTSDIWTPKMMCPQETVLDSLDEWDSLQKWLLQRFEFDFGVTLSFETFKAVRTPAIWRRKSGCDMISFREDMLCRNGRRFRVGRARENPAGKRRGVVGIGRSAEKLEKTRAERPRRTHVGRNAGFSAGRPFSAFVRRCGENTADFRAVTRRAL